MNKIKEVFRDMRNEMPWKIIGEEQLKPYILEAMKIYGKYCSEQSWNEAIKQHSLVSLANMVNGQFVMQSSEEWWEEFQRKEDEYDQA